MLYMGDTGVGKSVVMEKYLENASCTDEFVAYTMKYSAQTKPTNLKVCVYFFVSQTKPTDLKGCT